MVVLGLVIISAALFQYMDQQKKTKEALAQAEALIEAASSDKAPGTEQAAPDASPNPPNTRQAFTPIENEAIGVLEIPKIGAELPIIEGTDEEMLEKGVGHYRTTVFPSDGEQILLSGHRDTVFRRFGELEIGDRFIVKMPYGTFEYEIASTEIVDKDDTSVIRSMGEEVLVVSTCYPFRYVGSAPDRYVAYAYPVSED